MAAVAVQTRDYGDGEATVVSPATMARSRRPAPVDLVHLARQTFGSLELEREVLGLFVGQGGALVRAIGAASAAERGAAAHRLKGSARGIGAMRVAALCEALEAPGISEDEVRHLVDGLGEAVDEVGRFVQGFL